VTADDLHRHLACTLLFGLNVAYEEVDETHIRTVRYVGTADDPDEWEAEVCCHGLGLTFTERRACPLDAALHVAEHIVTLLEEQRERKQRMVEIN
jgi:hypothetical protein